METIEAKNNADNMVHQSRKLVTDAKDKISQELKNKIENAAKDLEEVIKTDDIEQIKQKTEVLQQSIYEVSTQMYQQNPGTEDPSQSEEQTAETKKDEDGVVDAEFEEKK